MLHTWNKQMQILAFGLIYLINNLTKYSICITMSTWFNITKSNYSEYKSYKRAVIVLLYYSPTFLKFNIKIKTIILGGNNIMKLFVIEKYTKIALGNGNGELKYFTTDREFKFEIAISDPVIYLKNVTLKNWDFIRKLKNDPAIKDRLDIVSKFSMFSEGYKTQYKYMYVNFNDVRTL